MDGFSEISTGSLLTYPLPYRNLTYENRKLLIATHYVRGINVGSEPIEIYAQNFYKQYLTAKLYNYLTAPVGNPPLMIPPAAAVPLSQIAAQALMAHYAGDELMPQDQLALLGANLLLIPEYWKRQKIHDIVINWYTDLPVRDNTYRIDLP